MPDDTAQQIQSLIAGKEFLKAAFMAAAHGRARILSQLFRKDSGLATARDQNGRTLASTLVDNEQFLLLRKLIKKGKIDPNSDSERLYLGNSTLLEYAAAQGSAATVKTLLDLGADVTTGAPLAYALNSEKTKTALMLVKRGANVDAIPAAQNHNPPPIVLVVEKGTAEILQVMIDRGVDLEAAHPSDHETALLRAATQRNFAAVKMLVDAGANVHARYKSIFKYEDNLTTVMRAVLATSRYSENPDAKVKIINYLAEKDADLNLTCSQGYTALHYAFKRLNPFPKQSPDFSNNYTYHTVIEALARKGADVNAPLPNGETLAASAANLNMHETIKILAALGADLDKPNSQGLTPLMCIAAKRPAYKEYEKGRTTARLLVKEGATINAKSVNGYTAFMLAAEEKHCDATGRPSIAHELAFELMDLGAKTTGLAKIKTSQWFKDSVEEKKRGPKWPALDRF